MRTLRHLTTVAVTTIAVVGASVGNATAQQTTITDKRADVVHYADSDDETGTILGSEDSIASGVDITRFRVKHGKTSIGLTINVADLAANALVIVAFRSNGEGSPTRVFTTVSKTRAEVFSIFGENSCRIPITTKHGSKGYVTATFKRSCLDNPKKLKASAMVISTDDNAPDEPLAVDSASATKYRTPSWTPWLKRG